MKLLNHVVEANLRSRQPISHLKIHRRAYWSHLVWWKLSLIWGQPHLEPVEIHKGCGGTVCSLGEDGISYCEACEHICEGETEYVTTEEWETMQ